MAGIEERIPYNKNELQISFSTEAETIYYKGRKLSDILEFLEGSVGGLNNLINGTTNGLNGRGIINLVISYAALPKNITSSSKAREFDLLNSIIWKDSSPEVDDKNPHLWKKIITTWGRNEEDTEPPVTEYLYCGSKGDKGIDGDAIEWIFKLASENNLIQLLNELDNSFKDLKYLENDFVPFGWADDMLFLSPADQERVLWSATRFKKDGVWGRFENLHVFNRPAKDGDGLFSNSLYTSIKENGFFVLSEDAKEALSKITLKNGIITNIPYKSETNNIQWYDSITENLGIVYMMMCYFDSEGNFVKMDNPIRITGPLGEGSDGLGVEFAYYVTENDLYTTDSEIWPATELKTISPYENSSNLYKTWSNHAGDCPISSAVPYKFASTRQGYYNNDDDWEWGGVTAQQFASWDEETVRNWDYGWSRPFVWSCWGHDGVDGDGVQYVYLQLTENEYQFVNSDFSRWNLTNDLSIEDKLDLVKENYPITVFKVSDQDPDEHWLESDITKLWTDNPQGVSEEYPYEFVCTRYYTFKENSLEKGWQLWDTDNISLWSHFATLSDENIQEIVSNISIESLYNYTGQASRIRTWEDGKHYFPILTTVEELDSLLTVLKEINDPEEIVETIIGGKRKYCPRFYDIVYFGANEDGTPQTWLAKAYSTTVLPIEGDYWSKAALYDFIKANAAYITKLSAESIETDRILIKNSSNTYVAGVLNGESAFKKLQELNTGVTDGSEIVLFAGLPESATSLNLSAFYVTEDGSVYMSKGSIGSGVSSSSDSGLSEEDSTKLKSIVLKVDGSAEFKGAVNAIEFGFLNEDKKCAKFKYFNSVTLGEATYTNSVLLGIRSNFNKFNDEDDEYNWLPLSAFKPIDGRNFSLQIQVYNADLDDNTNPTEILRIRDATTLYYDTWGDFYNQLAITGAIRITDLKKYVYRDRTISLLTTKNGETECIESENINIYKWFQTKVDKDTAISKSYVTKDIQMATNYTIGDTIYSLLYGRIISLANLQYPPSKDSPVYKSAVSNAASRNVYTITNTTNNEAIALNESITTINDIVTTAANTLKNNS